MYLEFKEKPIGASSGIPILNEPILPHTTGPFANRRLNIRLLVEWVKQTPEAIGILRAIAHDVVTKISFSSVSKQKTGRPSSKVHEEAVSKAEKFAQDNQLKQQQIATVIDWIMTGDFYVWMDIGTLDMVKEAYDRTKEQFHPVYKKFGIEFKEFKSTDFIDEDYSNIQKIRYVPSETVDVDFDDTQIKGFAQETYAQLPQSPTLTSMPTGIRKRYWRPNKIIHGKFMEMSGKVHGYTPFQGTAPIIRTLGLIKDYAGNFFQNGGVPDFMFMFESMGFTNKKNIEFLKQELRQYRLKKHGSLVGETSGKFQAIKLNDFHKDMEFRQLLVMYAGIVAFSLGFPASRLKAIIGADVKSSTGETDADTDGYERNIENLQDHFLQLWNTQLWMPHFGVEQHFSRGYRQDEVREVQRDVQKAAYLNALSTAGVIVKDEFVHKYLNLDPDDIKEIKLTGMGMGAQPLPNNEVLKGQASQAFQREKRDQAPKDKNKKMGN